MQTLMSLMSLTVSEPDQISGIFLSFLSFVHLSLTVFNIFLCRAYCSMVLILINSVDTALSEDVKEALDLRAV